MKRKLLAIAMAFVLFNIPLVQEVNSFIILSTSKDWTIYLINQAFPKDFLNEIDIHVVDAECLRYNKTDNECLAIGIYRGKYYGIEIADDEKWRYDLNHTILHEYGHHIWYYYLTKEQKLSWEINYNETKGSSEYGKTNIKEDFADYYAGYELNFNVIGDYHKIKYRNETRERILDEILRKYPQFDVRNITF